MPRSSVRIDADERALFVDYLNNDGATIEIHVGSDELKLREVSLEHLEAAVQALHKCSRTATIAFGITKAKGGFAPVSGDMPSSIEVYSARQIRAAHKAAVKKKKEAEVAAKKAAKSK